MYRIITSALIGALIVGVGGCQPTKSETSNVSLWPVWESHTSTTVREDGWDKTDRGDAVLIVHWNHSQSFDSSGKKTTFNEHLEVWPLFDCYSQKTSNSKTDRGTVLLFHYNNTQDVADEKDAK